MPMRHMKVRKRLMEILIDIRTDDFDLTEEDEKELEGL